jgi:Bacterial transcriptional activator domain/AAA ATPase domain
VKPERARLEALRLTALEDRIEADLALGAHDGLVSELEGLVARHPFRERLWGQLMLALYRSGQQADALAAFHRARQILDQELGIQPSRWLHRRQGQILLQDAALDAPEPLPLPRPRHNLPAIRSSFVGRRRELAELQGLLRTRRLVCVTGPPGTGKTRLAVEAAACLLEALPHGAFFASLAEVADPALVPSAVATALGIPEVAKFLRQLHDPGAVLALHGQQLRLGQRFVGDTGQQRLQLAQHDLGLEPLAGHRIQQRRVRVSGAPKSFKHRRSGRRIWRTEVVEQDAHGHSRPSSATTAQRYGPAPTR